jgi:hypothetical protein
MTTLTPPLTDASVIDLIKQIPADDYPEPLLAERRAATLTRLHKLDAATLARIVENIRRADCDPDAVDAETPPVSEWQDQRNSRP